MKTTNTKQKPKGMKTEIFTVTQKSGSDLTELVKEGENQILREKLGLEAIKLKEGTDKVFKYRRMTTEEGFVYGVLFTGRKELGEYNEYIPTEVLEAVADFKESCLDHICAITVWHAERYDPDPVIVIGTNKEGGNWARDTWIVARWGDAIAPFDKLRIKARETWLNKERKVLIELEEGVEKIKRNIKNGVYPDANNHSSCYIIS